MRLDRVLAAAVSLASVVDIHSATDSGGGGELSPEEELMSHLDLRESLARREGYEFIRSSELGDKLVVDAMVLTRGKWRGRYMRMFEGRIDACDKAVLKGLTVKMGTGEIYLDEEDAIEGGGRPVSEYGRWAGVLELMLKAENVRNAIEEGVYDEELCRMLEKKELADVLHRHILEDPQALDRMEARGGKLAKQAVRSLAMGGYWLYTEELDAVLDRRGEALDELWAAYTGEKKAGMSVEKLIKLARNGRLDGLVEDVAKRLVGRGGADQLRMLLDAIPRAGKLLKKLSRGTGLDALIDRGLEERARCGDVRQLRGMQDVVPRAKERLKALQGGRLRAALEEGLERHIRGGCTIAAQRLMGEFPELEALLDSGALDDALEGGLEETIVDEGHRLDIQLFLQIPRVGVLLEEGRLDDSLSQGLEELIARGRMSHVLVLQWEIPRTKDLLNALLDSGALGYALEKGTRAALSDGRVHDLLILRSLAPQVKEFLRTGQLGDELGEGLERLTERGDMTGLMLLQRVPEITEPLERLLNGEGLQDAVKEGVGRLIECSNIHDLLVMREVVPEMQRSLDRGRLDDTLRDGMQTLARRGKIRHLLHLICNLPEAARLWDALFIGRKVDDAPEQACNTLEAANQRAAQSREEGMVDLLVEGAETLIRSGNMPDFLLLWCAVPARTMCTLETRMNGGELDDALEAGLWKIAGHRSMSYLLALLNSVPKARKRLDGERLYGKLRGKLELLARNSSCAELEELAVLVPRAKGLLHCWRVGGPRAAAAARGGCFAAMRGC